MARQSFFSRSLTISSRPPDLERLPFTIARGGQRGLGVFFMLFALVWGGGPAVMLVLRWEELGTDALIALVFPVVGVAMFAFGFLSLFRRDLVVVNRGTVGGERRSLFGVRRWQEPLAGYRGLLLKTVRIRRNKSTYTAYAVFLAHHDPGREVVLYVVYDQAQARRFWERAATLLQLDALEETAEGEVARRPEDLDKSVRELAAEGKLEVDFRARPPPPALAARYDGGTLVVSTATPLLPGWAALAIVVLPWLLVAGDVVFLDGFATFVLLPIALGTLGVIGWDRLVRERLLIDREGVALQRYAFFKAGAPRRIAAGRIEAVRVEGQSGNLTHLAIVSDGAVLQFANGRPREALDWAREAVLAHVAAPAG